MAHINPNLFYDVVVPILQMKNTAFFGLSSPEGSQNFFSKLIKLEDNGHPFFKNVDCQLICEECRKLDMEEQVKCNHVKQQAHWLSQRKGDRFKKIYLTDPARALKELMGIIADNYIACFPKEQIKNMFSLPPFIRRSTPQYVFVAVDPSGGGISQLALCVGYFCEMDFVVSNKKSFASAASERDFLVKSVITGLIWYICRICL
jgi:hypothetical protein